MTFFLISVLLLILGYLFYSKFVEKVFGISNKATPAIKYNDGVDYVVLPVWKIFLIQFLNIAGLGPVFGAILGAVYGPVALLWIVFGSIFAGGVHDYLTGMFSVRFKGKTMDYMVKKVLSKHFSIVFSLFLTLILILVGSVFALNPAKMLANIFNTNVIFWCVIIFGYYFLTTLLPVDKIIGKFYPFFAFLLIVVTIALLCSLF
ncbi:carbon starvation protein A, partial [bacterium]|nr:carbon starvation protein A [bacterium]